MAAAKLKWGKRGAFDLVIEAGADGETLKQVVESLTGVPTDRQKLLCTKLWKGALKDDTVLPEFPPSKGKAKPFVVTLIGSAEKLIEKSLDERPLFEEDLTQEEVWRLRRGQDADAEMADAVDIVALQREVGMDRDDGKADAYQYNRLVTGLPQRQINDILVGRKNGPDPTLKGEEAMTLGMELRRAYIASIAVLPNGTVVSGSDDGHIHLWSRCQMLKDVRHGSAVDLVAAFPPPVNTGTDGGGRHAAFVSSGAGSVCLWTEVGDPLARFDVHPGTTPASLATGRMAGGTSYMAACSRVTRQTDPGMFRLVPQNEAERQRRREAMDREEAIANQLARESRLVRVWFHSDAGPPVQEVVPPEFGNASSAATCLIGVDGMLVCADESGCLRLFEWTQDEHRVRHRHRRAYFQFRSRKVACMERIKMATIAVSVLPDPDQVVQSALQINVSVPRGVCVVDLNTQSATHVLDGHKDTVMCVRSLPDGSLLTGGGKLDATVKLWSCDQLERDEDIAETRLLTEARKLDKPGYVFDMCVLPDSRGSGVYAIACARYNVVKIIV